VQQRDKEMYASGAEQRADAQHLRFVPHHETTEVGGVALNLEVVTASDFSAGSAMHGTPLDWHHRKLVFPPVEFHRELRSCSTGCVRSSLRQRDSRSTPLSARRCGWERKHSMSHGQVSTIAF
jgi:hypothetical protein